MHNYCQFWGQKFLESGISKRHGFLETANRNHNFVMNLHLKVDKTYIITESIAVANQLRETSSLLMAVPRYVP